MARLPDGTRLPHDGFVSERRAPPQPQVRAMFDAVAPRYDLVNDLLSLGLDRWWRREAVRSLGSRAGDRVLDLGTGTGKLGGLLAARCRVVGVDVSREMLALARRASKGGVRFVQGSAFALPFRDDAFDAAVSAFVLRNLEDLPHAFTELARVLRPGATISLMDITEPRRPVFRKLFDAYFRTAARALGALVGRARAYHYLVGSLGQIPPPDGVVELLEGSGFVRARARPLTGGMVTLFTASRS
jgi:demethylmenaquinone methyltransferase / 2-methoxy-6-polyprenyl-1,4-benzoquinol methylase